MNSLVLKSDEPMKTFQSRRACFSERSPTSHSACTAMPCLAAHLPTCVVDGEVHTCLRGAHTWVLQLTCSPKRLEEENGLILCNGRKALPPSSRSDLLGKRKWCLAGCTAGVVALEKFAFFWMAPDRSGRANIQKTLLQAAGSGLLSVVYVVWLPRIRPLCPDTPQLCSCTVCMAVGKTKVSPTACCDGVRNSLHLKSKISVYYASLQLDYTFFFLLLSTQKKNDTKHT